MPGSDYAETGSRIFRALARFILAVLIGVGLTLAWQSYGNEGLEMAKSYAPSLARLLPVPKTKSSPGNQVSTGSMAIEVKQQLKPIAREFGDVRRRMEELSTKIDQLAESQKQVAQNIATLQAVDHDISQNASTPPPGANTPVDAGQQGSDQKPSSPPADASTTAQKVSDKCDIEACKQAYFTFNPADCTYQPNNGPRELCTKGTPPSARTAQIPGQATGAATPAAPQVSDKCDIEACKRAYRTFNPADCTFKATLYGPRQLCTKGTRPQ